jgi:ABC-type bacteriocin/lantibiotic exporter with double-glycine peptidase domain
MQSKLPFYKQEKPYSCVPACLRIVLAAQGQMVSESELRERCDCTFLGTEAVKAVDALRTMGFSNSNKCTLKIAELIAKLNVGLLYPIVFVNLLPIDGINDPHAIVVAAIDEDEVLVSDPLQGERLLPRSTFDTAWAMMRNLTILVQD